MKLMTNGKWQMANLVSGQVLIIGVIFLTVILVLSASLFTRVANYLRFNSNDITREQATSQAEAGADFALWKLNTMAGSCGSGGTQWCNVETAVGTTGTFEVSVVDKTSSLKTVTSTGYIPNKANPRAKRTVKMDAAINSTLISFNYAVQVGDGGLDMDNSSKIEGSVYTNGSINGSGSTIITGSAWAVGTISSPHPTIQVPPPHPSSPPTQMPTVDDQYWKTKAEEGGITNCPGGQCQYSSGNTQIGPQKLIGNLDVQNTATLTVNGPIWVTGNVNVQNSAKIKLNDSFGSQGTVMIIDGTMQTQNSGGFEPTNGDPKGYILVVSTSTRSDAIQLQNSSATAIFYALAGGAQLSNSAKAAALIAKSLHTQNFADVKYDLGLAGSQFSSGPGGSWGIKKGTYRFTQ